MITKEQRDGWRKLCDKLDGFEGIHVRVATLRSFLDSLDEAERENERLKAEKGAIGLGPGVRPTNPGVELDADAKCRCGHEFRYDDAPKCGCTTKPHAACPKCSTCCSCARQRYAAAHAEPIPPDGTGVRDDAAVVTMTFAKHRRAVAVAKLLQLGALFDRVKCSQSVHEALEEIGHYKEKVRAMYSDVLEAKP